MQHSVNLWTVVLLCLLLSSVSSAQWERPEPPKLAVELYDYFGFSGILGLHQQPEREFDWAKGHSRVSSATSNTAYFGFFYERSLVDELHRYRLYFNRSHFVLKGLIEVVSGAEQQELTVRKDFFAFGFLWKSYSYKHARRWWGGGVEVLPNQSIEIKIKDDPTVFHTSRDDLVTFVSGYLAAGSDFVVSDGFVIMPEVHAGIFVNSTPPIFYLELLIHFGRRVKFIDKITAGQLPEL